MQKNLSNSRNIVHTDFPEEEESLTEPQHTSDITTLAGSSTFFLAPVIGIVKEQVV